MNNIQLTKLLNDVLKIQPETSSEVKLIKQELESPNSIDQSKLLEIQQLVKEYYEQKKIVKNRFIQQSSSLDLEMRQIFKKQIEIQQKSPKDLDEKYKNYLLHKKQLKQSLIDLSKQNNNKLLAEFVSVMPFYEKLRHEVVKRLQREVNLEQQDLLKKYYVDFNFFKRQKPKKSNDSNKNEFQIKMEQEKRKRAKEKIFMQKVFEQNSNFIQYTKKQMKTYKKSAVYCKYYLDSQQKKTNQLENLEKRKRIEAFKTKKIEKYIDLLKQTKEKRILKILEETENFLREIGMRVVQNKGDGDEVTMEKQQGKFDVTQSSLNQKHYKKIYYKFTHTMQEEILVQPSILIGGTLKKYQIKGLSWMISLYNNKLNGILADEMGLGKTIQTIALFCYLIEKKQNFGPFLIVVPLSTLTNWKLEFEKWAPSINIVIYKGNPQERKDLNKYIKNNKFNICLTTYEYILIDKNELNRFQWKYIVVDEGHKLKNSQSKFAQTLGLQYQSQNRLLLTGTPLQNNLTELWALFNFLLPKVFSSSEDFEKWFRMPMKKIGKDFDADLNEEERMLLVHRFHQVLRPFLLRREKSQVESELPKKKELIIKVELSAWQKIVYNQITERESLNLLHNSKKYNRFMMSNVIMQQRKICNHPYIFLDYYTESEEMIRSSGKFELMDRIIPKLLKTGHRLLIFTQMTTVIQLMSVYFQYRGIKHLILDGSTKLHERAERMKVFNEPNSPFNIFILSTRAGGLGLNLQTADTVILFDSDWNPKIDEQAQDRAHRIGTKKEVRVFRFVTVNSIEEKIISKAQQKKNLVETLIEAGLYNTNSTEIDRKERLEAIFKKQSLEVTPNDEIPNDEEVNSMLSRSDDEFRIYQTMDQQRYEQEKKYYKNFSLTHNYRLTQYDEVPDYIKQMVLIRNTPIVLTKRVRPDMRHLAEDSSSEEEMKPKREKRMKKKELEVFVEE